MFSKCLYIYQHFNALIRLCLPEIQSYILVNDSMTLYVLSGTNKATSYLISCRECAKILKFVRNIYFAENKRDTRLTFCCIVHNIFEETSANKFYILLSLVCKSFAGLIFKLRFPPGVLIGNVARRPIAVHCNVSQHQDVISFHINDILLVYYIILPYHT